jgi:hypothetical protein
MFGKEKRGNKTNSCAGQEETEHRVEFILLGIHDSLIIISLDGIRSELAKAFVKETVSKRVKKETMGEQEVKQDERK